MAPSITWVAATPITAMATAHSFSLGSPGWAAGDGIVLVFCGSQVGADELYTITDPAGYEVLKKRQFQLAAQGRQHTAIYAKVAAGTENGTNVSIPTSAAVSAVCFVGRIPAATWSKDLSGDNGIFVSPTNVEVEAANPDPPSITVPWGAADSLAVAIMTSEDSDFFATAAPSTYTGLVTTIADGTEDAVISLATKVISGATEDPGAFTATSEKYQAFTMVISPPLDTSHLITGATFAGGANNRDNQGFVGPFCPDGDNLYVVGEDTATADKLGVFKSTDGGSTWTKMDTADAPTVSVSGDLANIATVQVGTVLHIATSTDVYGAGPSVDIDYHTFDMASDQWVVTNETVEHPSGIANGIEDVEIAVRTLSEQVVVAHQTTDATFALYTFSIRTGAGSWTKVAFPTALADQQQPRMIADPDSNDIHLYWGEEAVPPTHNVVTLRANNSLSTKVVIESAHSVFCSARSITWMDGATRRYLVGAYGGTNNAVRRMVESSGDIANDLAVADIQDANSDADAGNRALVWDPINQQAWAFWQRNSDKELMYDRGPNGTGWGTDVQATFAAFVDGVWATYYERDGHGRIGYVWLENALSTNTLRFDEIDLGVITATASLYPTAQGTITDVVDEGDATSDLWASIDDDPASPADGDWNNNTDAAGETFYQLTDMPSDFSEAYSATITIRYRGQNYLGGTGTVTLYARLYQSNETTALSDEVQVAQVTADSSFANTAAVTLTGIVPSDKTTWDGARLRLRWVRT